MNGHRCKDTCECNGRRTCSTHGYCQGVPHRTKEEDKCLASNEREICIERIEKALNLKKTEKASIPKEKPVNNGIKFDRQLQDGGPNWPWVNESMMTAVVMTLFFMLWNCIMS